MANLVKCLVTHAFGFGTVFTQAFFLVGFVLLVIAIEESPLRITFTSQDVRRDPVQKPAVVADHHDATGKLLQGIFQCTQCFDVQIIRGFVQHQDIATRDQRFGQMQTTALTA